MLDHRGKQFLKPLIHALRFQTLGQLTCRRKKDFRDLGLPLELSVPHVLTVLLPPSGAKGSGGSVAETNWLRQP